MFGNKQGKRDRGDAIVRELEQKPEQTQSQLARHLGVHPSTIKDDLWVLEKEGVLLQEDEKGRLSLFRRRT